MEFLALVINCARFDDVSERDVRLRHGKGRKIVLHLSVTILRFGKAVFGQGIAENSFFFFFPIMTLPYMIAIPREMKVFPWPLRR